MRINVCLLTGYPFDNSGHTLDIVGPVIEYEHAAIGKAKIAFSTAIEFTNQRNFKHPILAGICRNAFADGIEPPLIDSDFILNGIKNTNYPKSFKEKALHLLNYMYKRGGKDYEEFQFISTNDYPIAFASDEQEFSKIMTHLEEKYLIKIGNTLRVSGFRTIYKNVRMDDLGIEEIQKDFPKIPMISLVDQEVSTGDSEIDKTITHAKKLFFQAPQNMNNMRSACETLSYVLEPLRKELEVYFKNKDVDDFFQIVNRFDIRHNKESTKNIEHPEQLEWVFYSLLNTISTYVKLKGKLGT